jgi:hypothetical protein
MPTAADDASVFHQDATDRGIGLCFARAFASELDRLVHEFFVGRHG